MNKSIIIAIFIFSGFHIARAQLSPAQLFARKTAIKMKDSLSLTGWQQQKLYEVNMLLSGKKMNARTTYADKPDSMSYYMQKIENSRDSLYGNILTPEQMQQYKQKKITLIANN
jgi:hypothetical protein